MSCYPKDFPIQAASEFPILACVDGIQDPNFWVTPNIPSVPFCFHEQPNLMFSPEKNPDFQGNKASKQGKTGKKCHFSSVSSNFPEEPGKRGFQSHKPSPFNIFHPKLPLLPHQTQSFRIKNHTLALGMLSTGKSHSPEIQDEFKHHQRNQNINTCIQYFIHLKLAVLLVSFPKSGSSPSHTLIITFAETKLPIP